MERTRAPETRKRIGMMKKTKNVLLSPYSKDSLVVKEEEELRDLLYKLLPRMHRKKTQKKKPLRPNLQEYVRCKKERNTEPEVDEAKSSRKELLCGINEYITGIDKNEIVSAIVCASIDPKFMMQKLIDVAEEHKIPVIVLPGLRDITKSIIGFSSSAISVTVEGAKDVNAMFYELHMKILMLYKRMKDSQRDTSTVEESIAPIQGETETGRIAIHKIARPYRRIFERSSRLICKKRKMDSVMDKQHSQARNLNLENLYKPLKVQVVDLNVNKK